MVARDVLSSGVFKAQKGFVLLMIWTLCCLLIGPIWQVLPLVFISRQFTGSLAAETEGDDDKESVGGGGGRRKETFYKSPSTVLTLTQLVVGCVAKEGRSLRRPN